jgi:L-histidine Nalpha-methyltransferase
VLKAESLRAKADPSVATGCAACTINENGKLGSVMATQTVPAREAITKERNLASGRNAALAAELQATPSEKAASTQIARRPSSHIAEFAADVRASLTKQPQRELPSKYLYDELGSALFEAICVLPEYGLTRADARLLERHARDIADVLPSPVQVAELGSGSGKKTRWILEALARRQRTYYYPIEISASALAACEKEMGQIELVSVVGYEKTYLDGLRAVAARREPQDHLLVLFLGSTIGNFDRGAGDVFLGEVRKTLRHGDALLLGTDLVKDASTQILAYDDPAGVTAAFDLNLLARINRELGANFVLAQFRHEARWNAAERRIEMHLVAKSRQAVDIPEANLQITLEPGESIWTESSHKYASSEIDAMARRTGFRCIDQWVDAEWPFAQNLFLAE